MRKSLPRLFGGDGNDALFGGHIPSYLRRGLVVLALGSAFIGLAAGAAGASRTTPATDTAGFLLSLDHGLTWTDEVTEPILP
jgi:hypothetical protein